MKDKKFSRRQVAGVILYCFFEYNKQRNVARKLMLKL